MTSQPHASIVQSHTATLRIPAILQNPTNRNLRQVAAHNAQQREKADARRESRAPDLPSDGRGKRFVRRRDNGGLFSCKSNFSRIRFESAHSPTHPSRLCAPRTTSPSPGPADVSPIRPTTIYRRAFCRGPSKRPLLTRFLPRGLFNQPQGDPGPAA